MIADNYRSFNMSALRRTQGNQREADYLLDKSYFEYYTALDLHNQYVKEHNEALKNKGGGK